MHDSATADEIILVYERAFRSLLWRAGPRRLQRHVERLLRVARDAENGEVRPDRLAKVYDVARKRLIARLRRAHSRGKADAAKRVRPDLLEQIPAQPYRMSPDFHCDAALGGLARWLRAAGYDAAWWPGIDDDQLLRKSLASSAIMLTTDRPLAERGVTAKGLIPTVLVPVSLKRLGQFHYVRDILQLPMKSPRCMQCGGRLHPVQKESVQSLIPPRTYPWLDEYFQCERCQKLFWHGTHWQKIEASLAAQPGGRDVRPEPPR